MKSRIPSSLSATIFFASTFHIHAEHEDIISWVRSKGGMFSDKLEIRKHPLGYMGVFAKNDITAKEDLFRIPQQCYIQIHDAESLDREDYEVVYQKNICKLAHKLMDEMKLGEESEYAPYIAYLKTQKKGQIPANWSKAGKDALRQLVVPGSPMVDWIDLYHKDRGCIEEDDLFGEHMIELTIQRSYDSAFIPIWDMVNHDNGRINTENDSMFDEDGMKVRSLRDIKAGEEIFASYDKCLDCYDAEDIWGTPEILKDFGFIENFPRRWVFIDQKIWFEIVWIEEVGEEDIEFDESQHGGYGIPNKEQTKFLENELKRLRKAGKKVLADQGDIPDHEWEIIKNYFQVSESDLIDVLGEIENINEQGGISVDEL